MQILFIMVKFFWSDNKKVCFFIFDSLFLYYYGKENGNLIQDIVPSIYVLSIDIP